MAPLFKKREVVGRRHRAFGYSQIEMQGTEYWDMAPWAGAGLAESAVEEDAVSQPNMPWKKSGGLYLVAL